MANLDDVQALVAAMASPATRTPAVIDRYYTLCIPFYREFLGRHWHTGWYAPTGALGPEDQLRMELRIADSAALGPGSQVLDVGCGIGGTACHLAATTGARVHGLTPNQTQLGLAQQHARECGLQDRVVFSLGTADALPVGDASCDAVLFFESACHFPDRTRFFREVERVLRPGGRLAGEDWLAADDLDPTRQCRYIDPLCETWAIPALGTVAGYTGSMQAAGLQVVHAADMRQEMALARGFIVDPADRRDVQSEIEGCADPIRRLIMRALLILGEAVANEAFTIGRFLAVKPS